jgi:hypothetical protein
LGDADKDLLSRVVFADEPTEESFALDQARNSLRNLQKQEMDLRRSILKGRIQAAERGGDMTEALRLMHELHKLEGERGAGLGR